MQSVYHKDASFIVALTRYFVIYRRGCILSTGIFVGFTFIKIVTKYLRRLFTNNQQNCSFNLCDVLMLNFHSIIREINSISEFNTSPLRLKLGAWIDGKNKMHYVGLGIRKSVIFAH
jgi:hypothetical protein